MELDIFLLLFHTPKAISRIMFYMLTNRIRIYDPLLEIHEIVK